MCSKPVDPIPASEASALLHPDNNHVWFLEYTELALSSRLLRFTPRASVTEGVFQLMLVSSLCFGSVLPSSTILPQVTFLEPVLPLKHLF